MAGFAYRDASSPIHRGVFRRATCWDASSSRRPMPETQLRCRRSYIPIFRPASASPYKRLPSSARPEYMINNLGFSLEQFDAVGRFRIEDRGRPVNAAGAYITRQGETVELHGARGWRRFWRIRAKPQSAFVRRADLSATDESAVQAFGSDRLEHRTSRFAESGFSIKTLLVELTTESGLWMREIGDQQRHTAAQK
ncbi:MAG: hypothetical protein U0992_18555 [Planctomycetaceae bacterium]